MDNYIPKEYIMEDSYKQALSEMERHHIGISVYSLGKSIDYYEEKLHGNSRGFYEYMAAYDINLQANLDDRYRSLASLEHTEALHKRFSDKFEKLVPEIVSNTNIIKDRSDKTELYKQIDLTIIKPRSKLSEFKEKYATEIAAEKESKQYGDDKRIIEETMEDIKLASSGIWVPRLVSILYGEFEIESPESEALSKIAEKARTAKTIREIEEAYKEEPPRPLNVISRILQNLRRKDA
jgi:hypothetical protein